MNKIFILILIAVFSFPQASFAIDKRAFIESAKERKVLQIGLIDCVAYALKNNSDIKIESIEPRLKEGDVMIQKAGFEPTFTFDYTLHDNTAQSTSMAYPDIFESEDTDFNAGVSGKFITGTEYDIDFLNKRYKSNLAVQRMNPYYTSEPKITLTQPIFRDFGILVNRADIIIAQNDQKSSMESFKETVMNIVSDTKIAYYDYLYYIENYSIAELSLKRAQDLLEINNARYEKGLVSSVDLLETETAVSQREKVLISSESALKKSEDELKLITSLVDDPTVWNAEVELIDKPEANVEKVDLIESLNNAFKHRPDYKEAKIDLDNRDIKIKTAKNSLLPTVDLMGSFGLNGLGDDFEEAVNEIDWDNKDWSVGVAVSVPWGGAERAEYNQREFEKAQALISFKRLEQDIILEVRDKVREIDIMYRQMETSRLAKEKETENYKAQEERYAAGQVSTHDILDYQDRLAQAELDYIKALIDYNIALINLDMAMGLTLVKNDITLKE
ncbi:MAG: TolC family protein [Candidatus Omnitrophica bacterium]|nr:TolC family protein [Candidatus Omnitrophota bacterium]